MSRWIVRALVSIVVLAVLLTVVSPRSVVDALSRTSPWVWTTSLAIFFAGHSANSLKLRLLVGPWAPPAWLFIRAQYAGLAANLGLPGLAGGDFVRAACLVPAIGVKRAAVVSLADRLLDTAMLVVMIAVALPLVGVPAAIADIVDRGRWWLAATLLTGAAMTAAALYLTRTTRVGQMIGEAWRDLAARRASLALAVAISLGVQASFVLTNVWLAREVGVTTGLAAWFVAWPLSKLIAVLPISLGGLGVREAALVSLLGPYGADGEAVLASGLLWQAVLAVSGLIGLAVTQVLRGRQAEPTATPALAEDAPLGSRPLPRSSNHVR